MMLPKWRILSLITVWLSSFLVAKGDRTSDASVRGSPPVKDSIVNIGSPSNSDAFISLSSPSVKERIVNLGISSIRPSYVNEGSPFCKRENDSLMCDYTQYSEDIHLQNVSAEVTNIIIKGGRELRLFDNSCVSITLINIHSVHVHQGVEETCEKDVSFEVIKSTIDRLPTNVSHIRIKDSEIGSLNVDSQVKSVKVLKSRIRHFNVSKSYHKTQNIVVYSTDIENIHNLYLGSDYLLIKDSNFNITDSDHFPLTRIYQHSKDTFVGSASEPGISRNLKTKFFPRRARETLVLQDKGISTSTIVSIETSSVEVTNANNSQICSKCTTYLIGFVASLILLLIMICLTFPYVTYLRKMIYHIERQLSNPDLYDYRKDNNFLKKQLLEQKDEKPDDSQSGETQSLLDTYKEQCQYILETVEDMNEKIMSVLKVETTKNQNDLSQITVNYERELDKLMKASHGKKGEFEKSKMIEMENLEVHYEEEFNNPTILFWDRIRDVLEKSKAFNKELIEERYAIWMYNERLSDDSPLLKERADKVLINTEFITQITTFLKEHINNWSCILSLIKQVFVMSSSGENLFNLLENLIVSHQLVLEENYDRQIKDQDNKYLSDMEEQENQMTKNRSVLISSVNEEKEHMLKQMSKDLESKLPWTKKYIDEVENLYSIRSQLLDTKLEYEIKKAEHRHSETQVKLLHLDVILATQKNYMKNLEYVIHTSVESLKACVITLLFGLHEHDNTSQNQSSNPNLLHGKPFIKKPKMKSRFEDRFAQA